jgi:hypothetical protein
LWVSQSYSGLFIQNKLSTLDMNFPTSEKTKFSMKYIGKIGSV